MAMESSFRTVIDRAYDPIVGVKGRQCLSPFDLPAVPAVEGRSSKLIIQVGQNQLPSSSTMLHMRIDRRWTSSPLNIVLAPIFRDLRLLYGELRECIPYRDPVSRLRSGDHEFDLVY
ncbi:predicted protein [Histoplasma capsulatum H143]|uniref:Uncharacterized protein n=1 Tax=Ajellomyces capsulatus (strain H143) TaxID=544712 RepID=C6H332_AJECH|nr:predicted protein [Histoplasma capsulatum H143]